MISDRVLWMEKSSKHRVVHSVEGKNTISTLFCDAAIRASLNTTGKKNTNHYSEPTAVPLLARQEVIKQQIIIVTGHLNTSWIKPYLQLDAVHYAQIIE